MVRKLTNKEVRWQFQARLMSRYGSVRLTTEEIKVLLFADDLMMMAKLEKALQHNMQERSKVASALLNEICLRH